MQAVAHSSAFNTGADDPPGIQPNKSPCNTTGELKEIHHRHAEGISYTPGLPTSPEIENNFEPGLCSVPN